MITLNTIPKHYTDLLNQVFEMERKAAKISENHSLQRNINRMKDIFEHIFQDYDGNTAGLVFADPTGERYDETRTDCDASIAGTSTEHLVIVDVIKPIIYVQAAGSKQIVQKAVVVVESRKK